MICFTLVYLVITIILVNGLNNLILPWIAINLVAILVLRKTKLIENIILATSLACALFFIFGLFNNEIKFDGKTSEFTAVIYEDEERYDEYSSVFAKVTIDGNTFKSKLYLENADNLLKVSDTIIGSGYFYEPTDKRGFNANKYYKSQGINLLCSVSEYEITYNDKTTFSSYFNDVRNDISYNISTIFNERNAGIIKGLILGDKSDLSFEDSTYFSKIGISHVLAVSGLHISFLCALCMIVLGRGIGHRVSVVIIIFYALVVGFSPSIARAVIMQLVMIFCWHNSYKYSSLYGLSISLILLLVQNPFIIYDIGFVLSFASSLSIILLTPKFFEMLKCKSIKINKYIIQPMCIYLAVFFGTLVPVIYFFGSLSTLNVISNIFILPFISFLFPCALILVCISLINLKIAVILGKIVELFLSIFLTLVEFLAEFKYSLVTPSLAYVVIVVAIVLVIILSLSNVKVRKTVLLLSLVSITSLNLFFSHKESLNNYIYVFSVGDGETILLKYDDEITLIDCGSTDNVNAGNAVNEYLFTLGIDTIDHFIITSIDKSHMRDIEYLNLDIKNIYYPEKVTNAEYNLILEDFLGSKNIQANPIPPDYIELFTDIDKKLVVKIDEHLFVHSLTNLMIDNFLEKEPLTADTIYIADKIIGDAKRLEEQLTIMDVKNVVMSNDYDGIDIVSNFPCKTTIKYGDIKILMED